jgi:ferredoxin-NADP reductase
MSAGVAARDIPPDALYGAPGRADRLLRGLTAFSDTYLGAMAALRALRGQARPREPGPEASQWRELVVTERAGECAGVISLRLAAPPGSMPPRHWRPGAHIQVELPSGKLRHYSLCGDPADHGAYRIAVRRIDGGGGSAEIHDTIRNGTVLRVAGPRNAFPFAAEPAVLFIAGGIGITPILPMARLAAVLSLDWRLVYAGRGRATMPFLAEVAALDRDTPRAEILADEETGVPDCAELLTAAPEDAAVYACGPPPMLAGLRAAAETAIAACAIRAFHFERFTAPPIADGRAFEVEISSTGDVLAVPAGRSVLDVLRARLPGTPYSCQQGFCGTCRQRVLRGSVEHRDQRLNDSERAAGDMLVCVSRAPERERLILDL